MNNKKFWILSLTLALCFAACVDEDEKLFDDFERGAIPLFAVKDDDTGFINLIDVNETKLSFSVTKRGLAEVSSIDITVTYNNSETGSAETAVYTSVTSYPSDLTITVGELLQAFSPSVVTADSLSLGDSFVIGGAMRMTDGRYLDGGYSPSIFSKQTVTLTYNVACPSDLGGTLNYSTTVFTAGAGGNAAACAGGVSGEVEFEDIGGGRYNVSDITFGQYDCAWNDSPATGVVLSDICGNLTLTGTDQYGLVYSISIVSNNGTELVIDWENDYGDSGRTILTRTGNKQWPLNLSTN
jgi:hypothetical protein